MYEKQKKKVIEYIEKNMSEKRKVHTYGVRDTALLLGKQYMPTDTDSELFLEKCEIAALFHDMFRGIKVDTLNYYVKHLGLHSKYMDNANLAHGKIAAIIMKRDYDINDEDIINAVSYHTTGRAGMSILEKIIYIADAIEPNRVYPKVDEIREIAKLSLDKACLASMDNTISFVDAQGKFLDNDTREAASFLRNILK